MKPFIQRPDEYPRENRQHQHRYIVDRPPRQIEQQGEHAIFDKMECLNDVGIGVAGAEDPREERASHQGCAKGEIAKHPAPSERVARAEASLGAANPSGRNHQRSADRDRHDAAENHTGLQRKRPGNGRSEVGDKRRAGDEQRRKAHGDRQVSGSYHRSLDAVPHDSAGQRVGANRDVQIALGDRQPE